jgi:hypothetical protein
MRNSLLSMIVTKQSRLLVKILIILVLTGIVIGGFIFLKFEPPIPPVPILMLPHRKAFHSTAMFLLAIEMVVIIKLRCCMNSVGRR